MIRSVPAPLASASVVITRPAGTATALARRVRALGGHALLLPGLSLRAATDARAARAALRAALAADVAIFTSPAAVRFAAHLRALHPVARCRVFAVGQGTVRALHRHGITDVGAPATDAQDSEGLLAHPALTRLRGRCVALVGAPGGRDVLARTLRARGATVLRADVYRRVAARLDRRHLQALHRLRGPRYVLLSSGAALAHLQAGLPAEAWRKLLDGVAVVSSGRLAIAARAAGFSRVDVAHSPLGADLLACAAQLHGCPGT